MTVAGLVLTSIVSGCLSGSPPAADATDVVITDEPKPTGKVNQSKVPLPPGADPNLGAIRGDVLSVRGGAIKHPHLILFTEPRRSTDGNEVGAFAFNDVPPEAWYTLRGALRGEAKGYLAAEVEVFVEKGWLTLVNLSLEPEDPNNMEHVHDYWFDFGGTGLPVTKRTLFDGTVEYPTSLAHGGQRGVPAGCLKHGNDVTGEIQPNGGPCFEIPVWLQGEGPNDGIVWPGTKQLEVSVSWSKGHEYVPNVTFQYQPANTTQYFGVVLESGDTKSIEVKPEVRADGKVVEMADNGHARWSKWRFKLYVEFRLPAGNASFNSGDLIRSEVGPFAVSIVAYKGVLPAEPTHPRPWLNGAQIVVVDNLTKRVGATADGVRGIGDGLQQYTLDVSNVAIPVSTHDRNASLENDPIAFFLPANKIIPAGTTKLKVTLTYGDQVYNETDLAPHRRSLSFRTASVYPARATLGEMKTYVHTATKGKTEWTFDLADPKGNDGKDDETDSVYSVKSGWKFLLANEGKEREDTYINWCSGVCGGTYFFLTVVAINTHWQQEFDAGLI